MVIEAQSVLLSVQ